MREKTIKLFTVHVENAKLHDFSTMDSTYIYTSVRMYLFLTEIKNHTRLHIKTVTTTYKSHEYYIYWCESVV